MHGASSHRPALDTFSQDTHPQKAGNYLAMKLAFITIILRLREGRPKIQKQIMKIKNLKKKRKQIRNQSIDRLGWGIQ